MLKFILLAYAVLNTTVYSHAESEDIRALLPSRSEVPGWEQNDSARVFTGEDLFTLINGGADVYLEYGFNRVVTADYTNGTHTLTAEVYEMSDPSAAFGIYSISTGHEGRFHAIGCEGQLYPSYILFWKGCFFCIISASDTTEVSRTGMTMIGQSVNNKIPDHCETPVIKSYLPEKGLVNAKYIRGLIGLSTIYTFDTKDIFQIQQGIVGTYGDHTVFLFLYGSQEQTGDIIESLTAEFKSNHRFSDLIRSGESLEMKDRDGEKLFITSINRAILVIKSQEQINDMHLINKIREKMD